MDLVEKRIVDLPYINDRADLCGILAPEFARSPIHRNRVNTVIHLAGQAAGTGQGKSILEIGSGMGHVSYPLARAGFQVRGVDIDQPSIDLANQRYQHPNLSFACIDATQEAMEPYDIVLLTEVLEHVRPYEPFLGNITRRMRPGSHLILTVPNGWCYSEMLCRPSYRLKTFKVGKPIVKGIKRMLGTRDVTTANELTPHVNFFTLGQLDKLFTNLGLSAQKMQASFLTWAITETFFSESNLSESDAELDYIKSQKKHPRHCSLWSFLLRVRE